MARDGAGRGGVGANMRPAVALGNTPSVTDRPIAQTNGLPSGRTRRWPGRLAALAAEAPQLRRRERPTQQCFAGARCVVEMQQTRGAFLELDARLGLAAHQPGDKASEMRLVPDDGDGTLIVVLLVRRDALAQPVEELIDVAIRTQRVDDLDP